MIGIYGGTFDPVHFGHLRPALDVYTSMALSKIYFIPCGQPPHREPAIASGQQRLQMLNLALEGHPEFVVDDREVKRSGSSYMIDTIMSLNAELPGEKTCLIVGMDAFTTLNSWHKWRELTKLVSLVVTHRPNFEFSSITSPEVSNYMDKQRITDKHLFLESEKTHCFFCPVTQLDISATRIRELVSEGNSVDFLLPAKVADYIKRQSLYS